MVTDEEIKEIMFKIERHPETFSYQVEGVSTYFLLRFVIESKVREILSSPDPKNRKKTTVEKPNTNGLKKQFWDKLKQFVMKVKYKLLVSMPNNLPKTPFLFFTHLDINHQKKGNFTSILKYYAQKGVKTTLLTWDFTYKTTKPSYVKKLFYFPSFMPKNTAPVVNLEEFLKHLTEVVSIDFSTYKDNWEKVIQVELLNADRLQQVITKSECKYVFFSVAYGFPFVLLACNRANIASVELQHGVMPEELVYYHSEVPSDKLGPETLVLPSFILTLGQKWKDIVLNTKYIYNNTNTFILGNAALSGFEQNKISKPANYLNVLVTTQPSIYNVKKQLEELAKLHKVKLIQHHIKFSIRPHPLWDFEYYRKLCEENADIFLFDDSHKNDLYQSLQNADIVLANTSMCLYEALALGKEAISLEAFRGQIVGKHVKFVESVAGLLDYLLTDYKRSEVEKYPEYLIPFDQSVLDRFLE